MAAVPDMRAHGTWVRRRTCDQKHQKETIKMHLNVSGTRPSLLSQRCSEQGSTSLSVPEESNLVVIYRCFGTLSDVEPVPRQSVSERPERIRCHMVVCDRINLLGF